MLSCEHSFLFAKFQSNYKMGYQIVFIVLCRSPTTNGSEPQVNIFKQILKQLNLCPRFLFDHALDTKMKLYAIQLLPMYFPNEN